MTIDELPDAATADGILLTEAEARSIAETYADACTRCHVLAEELRGQRATVARLQAEAEAHRVALAAALTGQPVAA